MSTTGDTLKRGFYSDVLTHRDDFSVQFLAIEGDDSLFTLFKKVSQGTEDNGPTPIETGISFENAPDALTRCANNEFQSWKSRSTSVRLTPGIAPDDPDVTWSHPLRL